MTTLDVIDWIAIAAGAATVLWVNWYFFLAQRSVGAAAAPTSGGVQEVTIAVRGGYDPATVRVKAGSPVRLVFDRQETSGCSEEVVLPDFGVRAFLPAHRKTAVEVTPQRAGVYEFTCGMSMLRGKLVAE
jgi:plastocyanin domain-containing protein